MSAKLKDGFIVVADIVGFTLKTGDTQRDIATFLVRAVESTYLFRRILHESHSDYAVACTGDGFILVVSEELVKNEGDPIVRFAEEVQALVRAYEKRLQCAAADSTERDNQFRVRIGLHRGKFAFEDIFGQRNAIGTGVNLACRIAACGDENHIVMSDEFRGCCKFSEMDQEKPGGKKSSGPYIIPLGLGGIKHDFGVPISAYARTTSPRHVEYGCAELPVSIVRQYAIDSLIIKELKELVAELSKYLATLGVSPQEAKLRLTILTPSRSAIPTPAKKGSRDKGPPRLLTVTSYRYCASEAVSKSTAAFELHRRKPEGVSAKAWCTGKEACLTQLPDRWQEQDAYRKRVAEHGMTAANVAASNRPCKAFLSIPLGLPVTNRSRFVLTLDSLAAP